MHLPILFFWVGGILAALLAECWMRRRKPWALSAAFVYITVFGWYFADLVISPSEYQYLPDDQLNIAYIQVAVFLVSYRLFLPWVARWLTPILSKPSTAGRLVRAEALLVGAMGLWLVLLCWGIMRMDGQVFASLFPINARAGGNMWSRGAAGDAGAGGFIVSTASYLYVLASASFGILFFFVESKGYRGLAATLMLISWPYFILSGTRSVFLAVCVPFFITYFLFSIQPRFVKVMMLTLSFIALNSILLIIINFRGVGLEEYVLTQEAGQIDELEMRHQGLNMLQELCFVNAFFPLSESGYGVRYLAEVLNVVPRVLWPNKPMLGIDYAIWRGFSGGDSDVGVVATVSTGLIGGGVLNFGPIVGPILPALFMSVWTGLLARWWMQRQSILRCFLYLAGLGLTFNLGRDITLLVLWPIVFAYGITRMIERVNDNPKIGSWSSNPPRAATAAGNKNSMV